MGKKILAALLTGMTVLSLAGCSYSGNASKTDGLMKKADAVVVYDASGKTKADVSMGNTKASVDFPMEAVAGGEVKNYVVLSIPDDVSSYDYKEGTSKILLKSQEGYEVNIEAYDYADTNKGAWDVVDKEKEDLQALAESNDAQAEVLKEQGGTCVVVLTYDRKTEVYEYFYNGTFLVKYKISYKSDGSQNLVTKAKGFIETLGGVKMP